MSKPKIITMNILSIECSTELCLLSLDSHGVILSRQIQGVRSHSQNILLFVDELLKEANIDHRNLSAVAVSSGPGSFTGVRLAVSIAKTLAWATNIPLIDLSSLALNAYEYLHQERDMSEQNNAQSICILRDAKMQEAYAAIYSLEGKQLKCLADDSLVKLSNLNEYLLSNYIAEKGICVQSDLTQSLIDEHALSIDLSKVMNPSVSSETLSALARDKFEKEQVVSALDFEPVYLRGKNGWKTLKEQQESKLNKAK